MAENYEQVETRLAALEARLAHQESEISRLRHLLVRRRLPGGWLALAGVLALLVAGAGGMIPAAAQDGKGGEGTVGGASTGGSLLLGVSNAPTSLNDITSIYNPDLTTLMTRTLRIANYTNLDADISVTYTAGFRTALVGFTSGNDTAPATVKRVGVMGLVDRSGYGVYGASPSGTGVTGQSTTGIGGEFAGGKAQLRLVPGATAGPPSGSSHLRGELYLGSTGDLFLCTAGGASPRWTKLNVLSSFLPLVNCQ